MAKRPFKPSLSLRLRRVKLNVHRWWTARRSDCPGPGEGCTCGTGIGCIHVPYKDW